MTTGLACLLVGALLLPACGNSPPGQNQPSPTVLPSIDGADAVKFETSLLQKKLAATTPTRPSPPSDAQTRLSAAIDQYFQRAATRRFYVHVDKPIYQPGETIWLRIWELATPSLTKDQSSHGITLELISPKGASVMQKRLQVQNGLATNDLALPASVQGGEYTLRASSDRGGTVERNIIVSQYQPPRIKKKLEFLRKAYGPGDKVAAALALNRATGEPLADKQITAIVTIDESEVARMPLRMSAKGTGIVKFDLPNTIARGDGLLTVLVADGGVTESIQKRIPILLREMQVQLFPEGGDLVAGLPGRVYFMAKNLLDKPADIEGRVIDSSGREISRFASLHNGMGRFEITPAAGDAYFVEITPADRYQTAHSGARRQRDRLLHDGGRRSDQPARRPARRGLVRPGPNSHRDRRAARTPPGRYRHRGQSAVALGGVPADSGGQPGRGAGHDHGR